jgi:hypothetical protein
MVTKELVQRMESAFIGGDYEFPIEQVKEFSVKDGKGYYVDFGYMPYSRGQKDIYVYIEYNDGEYTHERLTSDKELELWTKHLD